MLGAALMAGPTPVEVKEVVHQAVPYVGMAKVLDFLHATNGVLLEHGVDLPLPGQSTTDPHTRFEQGLADRPRLFDVPTQLLPCIGYPRTLNGLRAVDEVTLP